MGTAIATRPDSAPCPARPEAARDQIWRDIPLGQPYVVVQGVAVRYVPLKSKLPGKHCGSWYEDEDGYRQLVQKHMPTSFEANYLAKGGSLEKLKSPPPDIDEDGDARAAKLPVRTIEERVQRVRDSYSYRLIGDHDIWRVYSAAENGVDKHEVTAILTENSWVAVGCSCDAFENFDEMCVHCAYLGEWMEDNQMSNEMVRNGNHLVKSEPAVLMRRRERQAEFYAVVNDIYFAGKGTPALLDFVAVYCERNELDVFAGHVHVIERRAKVKNGDREEWKSTWSVMTGIHGYLAQADRTGEYEGITKKQWCNAKGEWFDIWLQEGNPAGARVTVHRKGRLPVEGVVTWAVKAQYVEEYEGYGNSRRKTGNKVLSGLWATDGPGQLMKCALSQALRQAFPNNARFRTDAIASMTLDAEPGDVDGERVIIDDTTQLSPEQQLRVEDLRSDEVHEAEFRDDQGEQSVSHPSFADQQFAKVKQQVTVAANYSHRKDYWFEEIKRRGKLDYAGLCKLLEDIQSDKPEDKPAPPPPASAAPSTPTASTNASTQAATQPLPVANVAGTPKASDAAFRARLTMFNKVGTMRPLIWSTDSSFHGWLKTEFGIPSLINKDVLLLRKVAARIVEVAPEFAVDEQTIRQLQAINAEIQGQSAMDLGEDVPEGVGFDYEAGMAMASEVVDADALASPSSTAQSPMDDELDDPFADKAMEDVIAGRSTVTGALIR